VAFDASVWLFLLKPPIIVVICASLKSQSRKPQVRTIGAGEIAQALSYKNAYVALLLQNNEVDSTFLLPNNTRNCSCYQLIVQLSYLYIMLKYYMQAAAPSFPYKTYFAQLMLVFTGELVEFKGFVCLFVCLMSQLPQRKVGSWKDL
jgi:hypothetical protein